MKPVELSTDGDGVSPRKKQKPAAAVSAASQSMMAGWLKKRPQIKKEDTEGKEVLSEVKKHDEENVLGSRPVEEVPTYSTGTV